MLYERITKDYMQAVKNKDTLRVEVLSLLRSAIKYREIDLREKGKELNDDEVIDVINKEIKKGKKPLNSINKVKDLILQRKKKKN